MRGQKVNDQPFLLMNLKFKNYNFISIKSKNCIVRILNSIFFQLKITAFSTEILEDKKEAINMLLQLKHNKIRKQYS